MTAMRIATPLLTCSRMTLREPLSGEKMPRMIAGYHKTPQAIIDRVKMFQRRPSGEKRIKRKRKKKKR